MRFPHAATTMCYSAQLWQNYRKYVRAYGADVDFERFVQLYFERESNARLRIAKAMDAAFAEPENDATRRIAELISAHDRGQAAKLEQELFKQRKRLADAERTLQSKTTKAALENRRNATEKIEWSLGKLSDLRRHELVDEDSLFFPGLYAPVMVVEDGRRVIRPMRYQCRPAGKPAFYDAKFPGTYNARCDSLGGFWKQQFGRTHGIVVANAFFENVSRHRLEGRELADGERDENVILEFRPRPTQDMLIACLWSRWSAPGQPDLWSFAAITDEPPAEVAAAGHDRCIIPIRAANLDAWLDPRGDLAAMQAILDDRERPYYEHRLAA
jgi:putative SOS response-associated peptidase YedK